MKKHYWQLFKLVELFPSFLNFSLQYKKSNYGHDISLYNLHLLLAKTQKLIRNNFCDVFVQVPDIKSI